MDEDFEYQKFTCRICQTTFTCIDIPDGDICKECNSDWEEEFDEYDDRGKTMTNQYFILQGHEPVPATMLEWAHWFENIDNRRVAFTDLGVATVSTVCLGMDHGWGNAPPLLFETMCFANGLEELNNAQTRCSTWEEAEMMHFEMVEKVQQYLSAHEPEL